MPLLQFAESGLVENGTGTQCEADGHPYKATQYCNQSFPHILPVQGNGDLDGAPQIPDGLYVSADLSNDDQVWNP